MGIGYLFGARRREGSLKITFLEASIVQGIWGCNDVRRVLCVAVSPPSVTYESAVLL